MSDPEQELHIEQALTGRGVPHAPRPVDRAPGDLVDRLADRFVDEADTAELPMPDGSVVRIVTLAEVEEWLHGVAIRLRAGEKL